MIKPQNPYITIPVEVSQHVYEDRLVKPFAIYLFLKMYSSGKVHEASEVFELLRQELGMKDNRTFKKHLGKVLELDWVGYNKKSGYYHVRTIDHIRAVNGFIKRRATRLESKDIQQLQTYLVGAIINQNIHTQRYCREFLKMKLGIATLTWGVANQSLGTFQEYGKSHYGISNQRLAKILGCKYTRACQLKHQAAAAGYIYVRHRYKDYCILDKPDYDFRSMIAETGRPRLAQRLKFWRQFVDGQVIFKVVQQLHDEIIPNMEFKRLSSYSSLKVHDSLKAPFLTNCSKRIAA
jgi:hypothetical protein